MVTVESEDDHTLLTMTMDANVHTLMANPLIKSMVKKAVEGDMDAVKAYCESSSAQ